MTKDLSSSIFTAIFVFPSAHLFATPKAHIERDAGTPPTSIMTIDDIMNTASINWPMVEQALMTTHRMTIHRFAEVLEVGLWQGPQLLKHSEENAVAAGHLAR